MISNERPGPQLGVYGSKTARGDVARGVKYVDSRRFILKEGVKAMRDARFLMTMAAPSWDAARHICEICENYNPVLARIASDRHIVAYVLSNMRARETMRALRGAQ